MPAPTPSVDAIPGCPVAVAGAGIAGLATAIALQRRGIQARVFERAPELKEVGAGLLLSPNAVSALSSLGLREQVKARSREITEWRILNRAGSLLQRIRPTWAGHPALSLHRAELQRVLLEALSAGVLQTGREVTDFRAHGTGIEVKFRDGGTEQLAALIGADGLRSAVRSGLQGEAAPKYSGYVGWRGISSWVPPDYDGNMLSESWHAGSRFGIAPIGGGRCYWYATANRPSVALPKPAENAAELLGLFRTWHAPICPLIEATPAEQIVGGPIHDRPARHPWGHGAVILVGDAAHPTTPNLGQGACLALEDACILAGCMSPGGDMAAAFHRFEAIRRRRCDAIQRASRLMGHIIQVESPFLGAARDLALRLTPGDVASLAFRPLFTFRP